MDTADDRTAATTHLVELAPGRSRRPHFGRRHPIADVAAAHCRAHLGQARRFGLGQIACGACWERAIRDDERFAVEFGLPREIGLDASYVDEVAVERACGGERVRLSPVELVAAVERLRAAGYGPGAISNRLGKSGRDVEAAWGVLAERETTAVVTERGEAA